MRPRPRSNIVGWLENPKVDNYFVYGKWIPNKESNVDALSNAICNDGDQNILLEGASAIIVVPPENGEIEIRLDPS